MGRHEPSLLLRQSLTSRLPRCGMESISPEWTVDYQPRIPPSTHRTTTASALIARAPLETRARPLRLALGVDFCAGERRPALVGALTDSVTALYLGPPAEWWISEKDGIRNRATSTENDVSEAPRTPANSPIHARLSLGTGRDRRWRLERLLRPCVSRLATHR